MGPKKKKKKEKKREKEKSLMIWKERKGNYQANYQNYQKVESIPSLSSPLLLKGLAFHYFLLESLQKHRIPKTGFLYSSGLGCGDVS